MGSLRTVMRAAAHENGRLGSQEGKVMFDGGTLNATMIAIIAAMVVISYIYNRIAYPKV